MPPASAYTASPVSRLWAAWDGAGALASFLCMIHCVGVPLLISAFPGLSFGFIEAESFHQIVAVLATILALSAFSRGYRQHHSAAVVASGVFGCGLLVVAAWGHSMGGELGAWDTERHETWVTVLGSVFLISAHLGNFRKMRVCASGHSH